MEVDIGKMPMGSWKRYITHRTFIKKEEAEGGRP
jgi:hypothetical protein